ncbi:3'(2'),5'-bisphosphate nucleotidase CysQ [Thiomicrospira microaerophila]|uniref:3'(2'),5'-bisphosphate nucleotidase CysQ n=1 Tax=Thiomicrospira microaerophila TaxID=406020 RepID=UPI00200BA8D6|nr:3'(2'),5'-bisphosphate nucleotidase CysQ [Thiomicrospira microaerophila]UQB41499.1 3'(2'),5'-bisphosphate nucleotidase CysQ [Thiomicrospira microaerophila]
MTIDHYQAWLPKVAEIAKQAGEVIMQVYRCKDCEVEKKADGSPVTLADKQADQLIRQSLAVLSPDIPVVSEENIHATPFLERQGWSCFWLVDPLDGTKEFIERTDEFCVNIALVVEGRSVLGVVYVPVYDWLYMAHQGGEAIKVEQGLEHVLAVRKLIKSPVNVTVSRRHGKKVEEFIEALAPSKTLHCGSAIKSCLVAEGQADVYPRFGPTSHWDTAASQVIVEAAGGRIVDEKGEDLRYFPTENILNPHFMVVGNNRYPWPEFPK